MPYKFISDRMYRMPTHFGPSAGPREGEGGRNFENIDAPQATVVRLSYLSSREQLDALLPEGFALEVGHEPVVTMEFTYLTEIPWLAGRGYNTLGMSFPVIFRGKEDQIAGRFLTVLWENLCDPILTGREELGFAKIYCELPAPRVYDKGVHCTASWLGFQFAELSVENLTAISLEEAARAGRRGEGTLHFKYLPKTGEWGRAEVGYITFTPDSGGHGRTVEAWRGNGRVEFTRTTWEDMPTQFHIVNGLRELEVKEYLGGWVLKRVGSKDLSDQRILR
jgi:hypothetical protein